MEAIEFVLLLALPHDCVTPPDRLLIHHDNPPFAQPNLSLDLRCGLLAAFVAQASDCSCGANSLSLVNRSSVALSCKTKRAQGHSVIYSSGQGAFLPSLLSRRTTTLGGDGDPEITDKFSSSITVTILGKKPWLYQGENALSFSYPGIDCGHRKNPQG